MTRRRRSVTRRAAWSGAGAFLLAACAQGPRPLVNDRQGVAPTANAPTPDFPDGLEVGHRLMDAGEYDLAIRAYQRAALDQGLTSDVLSALGAAHLKMRRLNQAERLLRAAIEEDDTSVPALNNLGVALNGLGEYGEAREMFRVAYALDNANSTEIRDNLRLLDAKLENSAAPEGEPADFRLVRRGNGQYKLLGN